MSNNVHPRVPAVNLKDDGSVDILVEIVGISPGNWAEISGYIIQENTAQGSSVFTPFSAIQPAPSPPSSGGIPTVTVNVPGLPLNPAADVKVIARVTQAQIWPTTLGAVAAATNVPGITATWQARNPGPVFGSNATVWGPSSPGSVTAPAGTTSVPSQQTFSTTGPNGARITVTVDMST
jgi:hypothetical protein